MTPIGVAIGWSHATKRAAASLRRESKQRAGNMKRKTSTKTYSTSLNRSVSIISFVAGIDPSAKGATSNATVNIQRVLILTMMSREMRTAKVVGSS